MQSSAINSLTAPQSRAANAAHRDRTISFADVLTVPTVPLRAATRGHWGPWSGGPARSARAFRLGPGVQLVDPRRLLGVVDVFFVAPLPASGVVQERVGHELEWLARRVLGVAEAVGNVDPHQVVVDHGYGLL